MDESFFYGAYEAVLKQAQDCVVEQVLQIQAENRCVEHITSRLKATASVEKKLVKKGLPPTLEQAKIHLNDLVGVRLVCRFVSDIFTMSTLLQKTFQVVTIKDYITHPKANGYRSYHMILMVPTPAREMVAVEIQLRTISQDAWACLEHQMKYKKIIHSEQMVREELKRCADELAATDLCMQAIRDFIDTDDVLIWEG